jgi:hypothetical protein
VSEGIVARQYRIRIQCPMCQWVFDAVVQPELAPAPGQVYDVICPSNASRIRLRLTPELIEQLQPVPAGELTRYPTREVSAARTRGKAGCATGLLAVVALLLLLGGLVLQGIP